VRLRAFPSRIGYVNVGPNVCVCVCGAQGAVKDELPQRILHSIWLLGIISDWQPLLRKACNCGCGWGAGLCVAVVRLLGGWVDRLVVVKGFLVLAGEGLCWWTLLLAGLWQKVW
jgi:hypothetical protein